MKGIVNLFASYGASGSKKLVVFPNEKLVVTGELNALIGLCEHESILEYYVLRSAKCIENEIGDHSMTVLLIICRMLNEIIGFSTTTKIHHSSISRCISGMHRASKLVQFQLNSFLVDPAFQVDSFELWCKDLWKHILGTTLISENAELLIDIMVIYYYSYPYSYYYIF